MRKKALLTILLIFTTAFAVIAQTRGNLDTLLQHTDSVAAEAGSIKSGMPADSVKNVAQPATGNYEIVIFKKPANTKKEVIPFKAATDTALQNALNIKIRANMTHLNELYAYDTARADKRPKMPLNISYLKQQVSLVANDTLRANYYHQIAEHYLKYDSLPGKKARLAYQDAALDYTLKAVHSYSKYNDIQGLRTSFNNLTKVYLDQRKYPQAKWFILQSNTISRQLKDVPNIVTSLLDLADIKMQIKDYALAQTDLTEALALTANNKLPRQEANVQLSFVALYNKMGKTKLAAAAAKRHDALLDSIIKADEAKQIATIRTQDSVRQTKKKLYTSTGKKIYKNASPKKAASL